MLDARFPTVLQCSPPSGIRGTNTDSKQLQTFVPAAILGVKGEYSTEPAATEIDWGSRRLDTPSALTCTTEATLLSHNNCDSCSFIPSPIAGLLSFNLPGHWRNGNSWVRHALEVLLPGTRGDQALFGTTSGGVETFWNASGEVSQPTSDRSVSHCM